MTDALWDAEAQRYLALSGDARLKWMARLLFALTVFARDTYTVGGLGFDDPERMRRFNELAHRVTTQLRNHVENVAALPEEVFTAMLGEAIQNLGVPPESLLEILRR